MNTTENNKLILEFMGYPNIANDEDKRDYLEDCVKYHTSWDWLMPVVEKMNQTELWEEYNIGNLSILLVSSDIKATYKAVIEFIKEYNNG